MIIISQQEYIKTVYIYIFFLFSTTDDVGSSYSRTPFLFVERRGQVWWKKQSEKVC